MGRTSKVALGASAALVALTACGGGHTADAPATTEAPAARIAELRAAPTTVPATTLAPSTTAAPPAEPEVSVDMSIGPSTTVVAGFATTAESGTPVDPFGTFAACSGLRRAVGNWSLQISDPTGDITAVSLLTGSAVTGPGRYDATFRLEFTNGADLDATGSIVLQPGLRSGAFTADDADLHGTFACTGGPVLGASSVDASLDGRDVKLFALLRRGKAERIISVVESGASCDDGVAVVGDAGVGIPVEVSVEDGQVAIRLGTVDLALVPDATETTVDAGAGVFHAVTTDGVEIDGAYSCS